MTDPLSVVVTDDDGVLRQLIALVLDRSAGYRVVGQAADAEECLRAVSALQPDVVLLDIGLPGLNGLDAIGQIKGAAPGALVIVLSAHDRERMADTARARGADGYLEKGDLVTDLVPTLTAAVTAGRDRHTEAPAFPTDSEQLAALAGHDLRGHLLAIAGHAQLLLSSSDAVREDPKAQERVEQIRLGTEITLTLVDDLLAYATSRWRLAPASVVDLDALLAWVVPQVVGDLGPASVAVAPLGRVLADTELARHLLRHLLSNALRFVAPGVTPHVEMTGAPVGAGMLEVRVTDNGIGIPADEREDVFAPFQRGSATAHLPGTGLGLAICRQVVTRYGGRIWVQDAPGGGTSMIFTLPRAEDL